MARKKYTAEQIINKLRKAEVLQCNGEKIGSICGKFGVIAVGAESIW